MKFSNDPLHLETLEDRCLLSSVQIFAGGTTGEEQFELLVDDIVVQSYELDGDTQKTFSYNTSQQLSIDDLKIQFTNDSFDSQSGSDRNLIVDRIELDGATWQTEHPSTFSTGSYTADGLSPGNWQTEYLHTNGFFQYSSSGNQSTIQIVASGSTGEEAFEVNVNGSVVGAFEVSTVDQTYTVTVDGAIDPNRDIVRVQFTNDLFVPEQNIDRDLFVDKVIINGVDYESEADTTYSTGTWIGEGIPHEGFLSSNTLHVSGYFEYLAATDIVIRASGDEGTEQISLQIEKQTVATFDLSTSDQDFFYRHNEKLTPDQIRVAFSGDEYDPQIGLDTNANVDWIEIRGERFETEAPTVYSTGTWTTSDNGVVPGFGRGSTLQQDGFFQYAFALNSDFFSLPEDSVSVPLGVLANDNVVGPVDLEIASPTSNGTLEQIDGEFFYTPNANYDGPDQFAYQRTGVAGSAVTVDINVRQSHQQPQSLINPSVASELTPSGEFLVVERAVKIPLGENGRQPRINGMATTGNRTFVVADGGVDGEGKIYELATDDAGQLNAELFLDVGAAILAKTGVLISNFSPLYGLRSVAFHPDFANNGKFYVAVTLPRPENPEFFYYLEFAGKPGAV